MELNVLTCSCGFKTLRSHLSQYFAHIKSHERNSEPFKCPSLSCSRRFYRQKKLQSHMDDSCFKSPISSQNDPILMVSQIMNKVGTDSSASTNDHTRNLPKRAAVEDELNIEAFDSKIFDKIVQVLLAFNTKSGLPMKSLQDFTFELIAILKDVVSKGEIEGGSIMDGIMQKIMSLYQINKSFKINNDFIEPTKMQVYGKSGFYCSIKNTIQLMLKCPRIKAKIDEDLNERPKNDGNLYSFKDGSKCHERHLKMIRLVLFFDDFDLHANQKRLYNDSVLICFLVIENLGRKFVSSARRLPLVLIIRRSQCSNESELKFFMTHLIQDLNELKNIGLKIDNQSYHCELIAVCGDSKAKAEILSYSTVFSSGAVCLMCNIQKKQLQMVRYYGHFTPESKLKNDAQRISYLQKISHSPTKKDQTTLRNTLGVTGTPILHGINDVNFSNLYTPDIFHDCIHGVLSFHLPYYLSCFLGMEREDITLREVERKIDEFNLRLKGFQGWTEPNALKIERKKNTSSSLNIYSKKGFWFLDLFRLLLEILDQEIFDTMRSKQVLSCFLTLRKIFSIICSPVVSKSTADKIHGLIIGYKKAFKRLFPQYEDKPKDHF